MDKNNDFSAFIKFYGPFADEGSLDIEKAGKSLVALNRIFRRYQKDVKKIKKEDSFVLKISSVNKNCTEIVFILDKLANVMRTVGQNVLVDAALFSYVAGKFGITEFGKQFFGTLGQQIALKVFSNGKNLQGENKLDKKLGEIITVVKNNKNEERIVPAEEWENYKIINPYLGEFIQLEKGKEDEMVIGYKLGKESKELARVRAAEKIFFESSDISSIEERLNDPFDEDSAEEITIVGKFIDYYGLAHKYHFSFQSRKKQDDTGKQKILCILSDEEISRVIDYLKPENSKNVAIHGKATRDWEDRIDKIKIEWINEDENFNPNQATIV